MLVTAEAMSTKYNWIATTGGPHLLLPEELLPYWHGTDGWHDHRDPSDRSDYARACRVNGWLGVIPCHTGHALVLSGDDGDIAWVPGIHQSSGLLLQWIAARDEDHIAETLDEPQLASILDHSAAEQVDFSTSPLGLLRLFDSSERGDMIQGASETIRLSPGRYRIHAGLLKTPTLQIVVRRFLPI
jgi:immunity protein 21 of polymorphic toxin system